MISSIDDINNLTTDMQISQAVVNTLFSIKKNGADGNCLFYSVSQSLHNNQSKAKNYRKLACDFYKKFDTTSQFSEDSLENKIKMSILGHVGEDENHSTEICKNLEYANYTDIFILADILKINIFIFHYIDRSCNIYPILNPNGSRNIYVKYNGVDHYEAMIPKKQPTIPTPSRIKTRGKTPAPSANSTRKRSPTPRSPTPRSPTPKSTTPRSPTPSKRSPTPVKKAVVKNNNIIVRGNPPNNESYLNKRFYMRGKDLGIIVKNPNSVNTNLGYLLKFDSDTVKDLPVSGDIIDLNINTGKLELLTDSPSKP